MLNIILLQNSEKSSAEDESGDVISIEMDPEAPTKLRGIPQYPCTQCSAVFRRPGQLKRHKENHKIDNDALDKNSIKEIPENEITEVELLLEDESFLKKKTLVACELCPSAFTSQSKLSEHMLKHTGERPFKCPQCDKSYPVKGT